MNQKRQEIEEQIKKLERKLNHLPIASPEAQRTREQIQVLKERLQEPQQKEFCFVIMSFHEDLKDAYDYAIKPAVESEGLECIRVDEIPGAGNILSDIIKHIHKAKMVIADLTGNNANVLYELGLAHALNNNVLMLAQSINKDLPFDLNNYRVIRYELNIKGVAQLKDKLQETIKSFDEWSQKDCNPVQNFLSPEEKPVAAVEHQMVKQELENSQQELREVQAKLEHYKTQEDGLQRLKEENAELQVMRRFSEAFLQRISGELGEGADFDEILERFFAEMDKEGEVTVSVPSSPEESKHGRTKRKKITFRPVKK